MTRHKSRYGGDEERGALAKALGSGRAAARSQLTSEAVHVTSRGRSATRFLI